ASTESKPGSLLVRPRQALQPPLIVRKLLSQFLCSGTERSVIVGGFVLTYIAPINRLSGYRQRGISIDDVCINLLRVRELFLHESNAGAPHLQPRAEPVLRQITFDAIALGAFRIHDDNRRCPDGLEEFEVSRMFFDVR